MIYVQKPYRKRTNPYNHVVKVVVIASNLEEANQLALSEVPGSPVAFVKLVPGQPVVVS